MTEEPVRGARETATKQTDVLFSEQVFDEAIVKCAAGMISEAA